MAEQITSSARRYSRLEELPSDTRSRLSYANTRDLFSSFEWFSCLSRFGFREAPGLVLIAATRQSGPNDNAYMLCLREDAVSRRLSGLTNYYTVRFQGFAGAAEPPPAVFNELFEQVLANGSRWRDIELRYLPASGFAARAFLSALTDAGFRIDLFHDCWNWFVKVDGLTFADYWSSRPSRLRNTVRRKLKLATARHRLRFEKISSLEELPTGLADYQRVYARSWKEPEAYTDFIPRLMHVCAQLGILRLGILYLDDVPVATQFWIVGEGRACIYKLSHDAEYDELSVGSLLTSQMFEQVIDGDRVREVDFGVGDERYKSDWMETKRQLVGIHAFETRTLRGALLAVRLAVRGALRRLGLRSYTPVSLAPARQVDAAKSRGTS